MMKINIQVAVICVGLLFGLFSCRSKKEIISPPQKDRQLSEQLLPPQEIDEDTSPNLRLGADRMTELLSKVKNKRVGLVINHTSRLSNGTLLTDTLQSLGVDVRRIFAPEHGFRGTADAGEKIRDGRDGKTGIPIISLYGKNYKPQSVHLSDLDVVVYDMQDVGARFYTYISTLHYVMEACAENDVKVIVLDRPNPNDTVDGPVLEPEFKSFVGMHPIPVLYGLTVGELAMMINGEKWLSKGVKCDLRVIKMKNWKHGQKYDLPIKPSPNLPNSQSVKLYPSLCFFEATQISVGRGTPYPFQVIGYPSPDFGAFRFMPVPTVGSDKNPLQKNKWCYGVDLREQQVDTGLHLQWLIDFYRLWGQAGRFFSSVSFMDKLAGTDRLRKQITAGATAQEIRQSWQEDLKQYRKKRENYLLYGE